MFIIVGYKKSWRKIPIFWWLIFFLLKINKLFFTFVPKRVKGLTGGFKTKTKQKQQQQQIRKKITTNINNSNKHLIYRVRI